MRALVFLLALAACSTPPEVSDWERQNMLREAPREEAVTPPPFPRRGKLIEFPMADAAGFHFFVDGSTLSVDQQGIVRYVLVAQSPSGAQNVSFEGLRCPAAQHRIYATGQSDGTWAPARTSWQPVSHARRWQMALFQEYFCPQKVAIRDAGEGVRALQDGGHPFAKGFSPNYGR
ncbi:MAG TPA: CNP1-like family protein [Burkholderiales bacterium]|nr:CNP1-like family protein [Burkholderiales bacterium]